MPKSMLKNVLLKSVQKHTMDEMAARNYASDVYAFSTKFCEISNYNYDRNEMQTFLLLLKRINGGEFGAPAVSANGESDVKRLLEVLIPSLQSKVQAEMPLIYEELVGIDWRRLFGITPPEYVVNVAPPSDEDSGTGSTESHN